MPGMKDDCEYNTESDDKMAMPQPILEMTRAPSLKDAASVSDDMLVAEMKREVGTMVNDRLPDITQFFGRELQIDLSNVDVKARIAAYL
ncbi:hypothetical protein PF004_g11208 [Phytophthora fragariae]|uniref:Uncharacterized protein n=1 Tax=Phytophthora fragariae TaxID=53985 RepID=A0A6A3FJ82_9STRA|nr:hypothetical protein PF009_g4513 [Phytophthora fragariae]KAE9227963.1 hypothetical protein PF004_g11208 [Phytophthora fragariae]